MTLLAPDGQAPLTSPPAPPPKRGWEPSVIIAFTMAAITVCGMALGNYSQWVLLKESVVRQEARLNNLETRHSELKDNLKERMSDLQGDMREIKAIVSNLRDELKRGK